MLDLLVNDSPFGTFPSVTLSWKKGSQRLKLEIGERTAFSFTASLGVTGQGSLTDGEKIFKKLCRVFFVCLFSGCLTVVEEGFVPSLGKMDSVAKCAL